MATGTGKTAVAFQICWKLWNMRWNRSGEHRRPKILYVADRNILVDDPKDKIFTSFGDARWKIENGQINMGRELYFAIYQAIAKDEISPAITPDGPRGPRFKLKPGAIFAAQISRKAVVPIAYAARPAWVLKTWDKFIVPPPFARIVIAVGEPYYPARRLDDSEMEAAQAELERRLHETFKVAKAAL